MNKAWAAAVLLVLGSFQQGVAQTSLRDPFGGASMPKVGSRLPDVELFDDRGQVLSTATLRGSYTVLVFGCLT